MIKDHPLPPKLEWIHTASVGVNLVVSPEIVASDIVVTHTRGVFEYPIAEYVLGILLMVAKDFRTTWESQRAKEWNWRLTGLLRGQTVVVIGPGAIGKEIFKMLNAVGVHVIAVGRRAVADDPVFGHIHAMDDLETLLPSADAVILCLPLTSATTGIMDKTRFSQMKRGACFINIGGGGLVDEDALIAALREGQVGTAGLDVFAVEPLPNDHPFWSMEQVFVSPHMSGDLHDWEDRTAAKYIENLGRWVEGMPLEHVIDKARFN
ncbi:D-2-hydroxyacid dehydrogenase [Mesorhizobium sp. M0778]|uniref:D-2-hydroxyacid dehydrogenase n=1 Tax=Mesorhizobium sp. M0778 TaxID=2956999 RepID=UPI00333DAD12